MTVEQQLQFIISNMATKDDISNLITKDDISNLITKDDISNLITKYDISNMATKDDVSALKSEIRDDSNMILNALKQFEQRMFAHFDKLDQDLLEIREEVHI